VSSYKRERVKNFVFSKEKLLSEADDEIEDPAAKQTKEINDDSKDVDDIKEDTKTDDEKDDTDDEEDIDGEDDGLEGQDDYNDDVSENPADEDLGDPNIFSKTGTKKKVLLKQFEDLLDTSKSLRESITKIIEREEFKDDLERFKVIDYLEDRINDVIEKIEYVIFNLFKSVEYLKLLTMFITLQTSVIANVELLENIYLADESK